VVLVRPEGVSLSVGRERIADLLSGLLTIASREGALKLFLPDEEEPGERHRVREALRLEMARSMMSGWLGFPIPSPTPLRDAITDCP